MLFMLFILLDLLEVFGTIHCAFSWDSLFTFLSEHHIFLVLLFPTGYHLSVSFVASQPLTTGVPQIDFWITPPLLLWRCHPVTCLQYHLYTDKFQNYASGLDLYPELQNFMSNCLLNSSTLLTNTHPKFDKSTLSSQLPLKPAISEPSWTNLHPFKI